MQDSGNEALGSMAVRLYRARVRGDRAATQARRSQGRCSRALVITITPEAGTVKDKERREVVLHAHIEELGLWRFVDASRDGYLFLNVAKGEEMRGKWRAGKNRLREFARKAVTAEGVSPNHGWRHTFKTRGREAGIEDSATRRNLRPREHVLRQGHARGPEGGARKFPRFETAPP